jgi:tetratricopeptide (TPR) repeat protein
VGLEGTILGIYRLGPELGRGGMGTVYRAESTAAGAAGPPGSAVAVKVFHEDLVADARAFQRFKLEAEIGKEIHHDHLVRTYEIGNAGPHHFMVMQLAEGRTLGDLLDELGTFPEHLLYQVAGQVLGALRAIHERGVVHRDLKPENMIITADHRVLLMDLGVARRQAGRELTRSGEFIGSLAYAPPEQLQGGEVGPRADLYALGVTLFELATGRNPYAGQDVATITTRKLSAEIDPPRAINPDLDAFWDRVIQTCVRRAPADRFASAAELLRILEEGEASEWWRRQGGPSALSALRRLRLERRTPLIGRRDESARLRAAHARAREQGAVLLVSGPSGVGKSRLLYDYLENVAGAGGPAIGAGRAVGAGGRGYGPFVEALGDILHAARLGETLPHGVVAPFAAFLRGDLQPGREFSKDALFAAVIQVLRTMAAERPLVLVLEDLHLAGVETVELFAHVARCVPGHPILLVGVYADDEVADDSPLAVLDGERLRLANLAAAGSEELVRFVVGHERTVRAIGPRLHDRTEGNPLLVLEVLGHLMEHGVLHEADGGLEVRGDVDDMAVPSTVRDLVDLKLAGLDEEQRGTLEAAAVIGMEFDASLVAIVVGEAPLELLQRLAVLERRHRLLESSGRESFRFAGRRLYDAVYEGIPEALRSEYHAMVADALLEPGEHPGGQTAYALLRHLYLAERALEAVPFLDAALDHMGKSFHATAVAPFLERVAEAFAGAPAPKRFAIAMGLWAFYDLLASRQDEMRVLDLAKGLADAIGEPGPRARVHACRAGSYWWLGDYDRAHAEAETGLALAREAKDRTWEATCHHTLGVVAYRRGRIEESVREWREALAIRREIGDRRGEASTLQALSLAMPAIGEDDRVLPTMQEALAIWREIGERRGAAVMLMNIGNHLVDAACYEEGLKHLEDAIEGHRETGAALSEATALTNLGRAQSILGRIDDARASWGRALELFVDLSNPNGELAARTMLGGALGEYGEHDVARDHLLRSIELAGRTGNKVKLIMAHRELGRLLHRAGAREEAWAHFQRALDGEQELNDAGSRVLTLAAAGQAALADGDNERAARLLAEALPDARSGGGAHAPLILCRLARAHRAAGRTLEAEECAREACVRLDGSGRVSHRDGPEIYYTLYEMRGDETFLARARALVEERARQVRNDSHREYYLMRTWLNREILGPAAKAAGP